MQYERLYHGTSESRVQKILAEGIKPRGKEKGNWLHTIESNPCAVYLTDAYPIYFAYSAAADDERGALIEIDVNLLDVSLLHPDEDVLEQAGRKFDHLRGKDMKERTRWYRRHARENPNWDRSLEIMGTCSYYGVIPPEAITRIVLIDWKQFDVGFLLSMVDCSISIQNYKFCKDKYRNYTRWAFGHAVTPEDIGYIFPDQLSAVAPLLKVRDAFTFLKGDATT